MRITRISWAIALTSLAMLPIDPAPGTAMEPSGSDTLPFQIIELTDHQHRGLMEAIAELSGADSLRGRARQILAWSLADLETECRTNLFPKEQEPGSPWIEWRALGRVSFDSCAWYFATVSCVDSLCGGGLVAHDRLGALCMTNGRSRVFLFPDRAATIRDSGSDWIDSAGVYPGRDHAWVLARRRSTSDHPCWDGTDFSAFEDALCIVVRGDSVAQSFVLSVSWEQSTHDDEEGGTGSSAEGEIEASAESIVLKRRVVDWSEQGERKEEARDETLRYRYQAQIGRFKTTK